MNTLMNFRIKSHSKFPEIFALNLSAPATYIFAISGACPRPRSSRSPPRCPPTTSWTVSRSPCPSLRPSTPSSFYQVHTETTKTANSHTRSLDLKVCMYICDFWQSVKVCKNMYNGTYTFFHIHNILFVL